MNETPSGERIQIGFFGKRNAGKSTVVNAVTNQMISIVSDVKGTTTDPVRKAMELLPLGPVMIIDTPGYDDEGALGELRKERTKEILRSTDLAVLVTDATDPDYFEESEWVDLFMKKEIPYLIVRNKCDLLPEIPEDRGNEVWVSGLKKIHIRRLKDRMAQITGIKKKEKYICKDLVSEKETVVLVIPIDSSAPKGRLILPQQQVIRELLDAGVYSVVTSPEGVEKVLTMLSPTPAMVITDSQVFARVAAVVPHEIPLTSFSILMARYKGFLRCAVEGARYINSLQDGDKILISEGCTHHRQCEDIGTVKIPGWLHDFTGKKLVFETSSGREFPSDLSSYALIIHCGGCMLNEKEMMYRMHKAMDDGIPFTNYGTAIAYMKGILERSIAYVPIES